MNPLTSIEPNRRILIVDDNRAIHEDLEKILCPSADQSADLRDDERLLFGTVTPSVTSFQIDSAYQGEEALEKVKQARDAGRPFALAFVDVRMPPGWDGVETITHLREVDSSLQTVILTAYSDYTWSDIHRRLGQSDSLLILKKPFENIEVTQLAHGLTSRWLTSRQAEARIANLDLVLARRKAELAFGPERYREGSAPDDIVTKDTATRMIRGNPVSVLRRRQNPASAQLRKERELFLVSLRVLSHIAEGLEAPRRDVILLRIGA